MKYIDAHIHFAPSSADVPMLETMGVKLLNICVAYGDWRQREATPYSRLAAQYPDHFAWCTTFDMPTAGETATPYADRIIPQLQEDFDAGAVAVKVWKNIGMEIRDEHGRYLQIDDPIFDPILKYIETCNRTVIMHIGEPYACWQPLSPNSPHYHYFRNHPEWHMWNQKDMPSHATLMAARDHVVERHSSLRVVGAHLGSLEYDLGEIARRFDQYENFAVDTSARIADLAMHNTQAVQEFFHRYQDRILWGTDFEGRPDGKSIENAFELLRTKQEFERTYYMARGPVSLGDKTVPGLCLPEDVTRKMFFANALHWFPDLDPSS